MSLLPRLETDREERLRERLIDFAIGKASGKFFDVDEMNTLWEDLCQMLGEIDHLREALEEIRKGEGPYSRDELTFAANVIDSMKRLATVALERRGTQSVTQSSPDTQTAPAGAEGVTAG